MKASTLAIALVALSIGPLWAQQTQLHEESPRITVSGEAAIYVKPDKIAVTFGIETSDMDILVAKQKNNDILKKALAAVKEVGIPEKDIQTDNLSVAPRYRDDYRNEGFIGYFVDNTVVVTLSDTAKIEDLITRILQAGVHNIEGIDFRTTELRKYRDQARDLALKAAKEKAERMAGTLGQSVGAPLQITESGGGWSGWGYGRNSRYQSMSQNAMQIAPASSGETSDTVALGKIAVQANVSVTFALK